MADSPKRIITAELGGVSPRLVPDISLSLHTNPDSLIDTSLTAVGIVLIFLGIALAIHYAREIMVHERASQGTFRRRTETEDGKE